MTKFMIAARAFGADESGATMLEYALTASLIAAVCVGAAILFGGAVAGLFTAVPGSL